MGLKAAVIITSIIFSSGSAHAGWQFQSFKDRMSGKTYTFAFVSPTTSDKQISLNFGCVNKQPMAWLETSVKFYVAPYIRYRFDNGGEHMHLSIASPELGRIYLNSPSPLLRAKRFRIEIMPQYSKSGSNFADFDLAGAKEAAAKAACPK